MIKTFKVYFNPLSFEEKNPKNYVYRDYPEIHLLRKLTEKLKNDIS